MILTGMPAARRFEHMVIRCRHALKPNVVVMTNVKLPKTTAGACGPAARVTGGSR
jgi:hypothetical protein